ncbi:collagenase [Streptomyces sp. NPDC002004]
MSQHRPLRGALLTGALAVTLLVPLGRPGEASANTPAHTASPPPAVRTAAPDRPGPHDRVEHIARAPRTLRADAAPGASVRGREPGAPGHARVAEALAHGRTPGAVTDPPSTGRASDDCTLDHVTALDPERFADFLAEPGTTADDCLSRILWTWDPRLAPIMSDAHVQAVSRRISRLAPAHDGRNGTHLLEMFTYLHAVVYQDFSHSEIDVTDPPTAEAMRRAINSFGTAARSFTVTRSNAETLREALYTGSGQGLRQSQLGLIRKVLATMDQYHTTTYKDPSWGGAALAALSVNYLGIYEGNHDTAFRTLVARNTAYRESFRKFSGYVHLKDTPNAWTARDALGEYGRFGQIPELTSETVSGLGALVSVTARNFGEGSEPWVKVAGWLDYYNACAPYGVCKADIERRLFPNTYTYDDGAIKVRTALDRATVDQLYYASKQVRAQFHRVLGTDAPLAGDANTTLTIVLYASRADYVAYQPFLTGLSINNGGMYIEDGATFYTYQRRVPEDSSLTLEELFRHEYTHYLNGRWAVPGTFGEGPWYEGDRTTAMDEGTAEFFDGATRDDGIAVRKSLVLGVIRDTSGGGPRMTVDQLLHATYDGDGFRFYDYAGTFFEYLWTERPSQLREMYGYLRADDPAGFDAWRTRMGHDAAVQRAYDAFLDTQIAHVDQLYVPHTTPVPNDRLTYASADDARAGLREASGTEPVCTTGPDTTTRRFICTGTVTAALSDPGNADRVFRDMSEAADHTLLDTTRDAATNFEDMNCYFGTVDVGTGAAAYTCEGPLRT